MSALGRKQPSARHERLPGRKQAVCYRPKAVVKNEHRADATSKDDHAIENQFYQSVFGLRVAYY